MRVVGNSFRGVLVLVCMTAVVSPCRLLADDERRDDAALVQRIDQLVEAQFAGREPAPRTNDAEFARRVWLDLAGCIPSVAELREFLADSSPDKRPRLVDRLLAAPTYAARMEEWCHVVLMERRAENELWRGYLRSAFEANRPWDQMVREILNPDPADAQRKGAAFFLAKRVEKIGENPIDHPGLTRDIGRLFLGVDLQCAQCHDHLFVDDYKQVEFQGLYAIVRTLTMKGGADAPLVNEKPDPKPLEFVSVFNPTQKSTGPRVPFLKDLTLPAAGASGPPPSVLAVLADELPKPENALFSQNMANRLWLMVMGRGLLHPTDLRHSGNPPSHPELLELLGREFAARKYDIRGMLRVLVLTKVYQRSSKLSEGHVLAGQMGAIPPESYLLCNERRLSAEQLLRSVLQATGHLDRVSAKGTDGKASTEWVDLRGRFVAAFANEAKEPEDRIDPSVKGALFALNDEKFLALWTKQPGSLMERLAAMSDEAAMIGELYLAVLSRQPTEEERGELAEFLKGSEGAAREKKLALWGWSLAAAMEFVVNH